MDKSLIILTLVIVLFLTPLVYDMIKSYRRWSKGNDPVVYVPNKPTIVPHEFIAVKPKAPTQILHDSVTALEATDCEDAQMSIVRLCKGKIISVTINIKKNELQCLYMN